jgi:polar amino acid transport system substrate-binding protein
MSPRFRYLNALAIFVACVLSCSFLLVGCRGSSTTSSHSTAHKATATVPYDLVSPGYLTVGTGSDKPPMEFMDTNTHQPDGLDIDLIKAIALHMNLQVKVVPANIDTLIPALNANQYDVVISSMTITNKRKLEASFIPYFSQGESLLVQNGNPHNIESLADLCGQSVGVQSGSLEQTDLQIASDACKKTGKLAINNLVLQDQSAVIQLLATNRVVATYQDSPVSDYYLQQNAGRFAMAGVVINTAIAGIAVRKTDIVLQTSVQNAFNQIERDGTYHTLLEKWGLADGAIA